MGRGGGQNLLFPKTEVSGRTRERTMILVCILLLSLLRSPFSHLSVSISLVYLAASPRPILGWAYRRVRLPNWT